MTNDLDCSCSSHQQPRCVHFRMGRCGDKVVPFPKRVINPGNGALQKLKEYFSKDHNWPDHIPAMTEADYFLAWLWNESFKIVPVADEIDELRYRLNYMEERFGRIDWEA